jgi:hypothetical protein
MCVKVNGSSGSELKGKQARALLFHFPCHYGAVNCSVKIPVGQYGWGELTHGKRPPGRGDGRGGLHAGEFRMNDSWLTAA